MRKIFGTLSSDPNKNDEEKLADIKSIVVSKEGKEGISELEQILTFAKAAGIEELEFLPTLSRGLEYYTGPVFEVYLKSGKVSGSLAAGGRYDKIIGKLIGSKEHIPAVGGTVGLSRIYNAISLENKFKPRETLTDILIVPVGTDMNNLVEALKIAKELRNKGYNSSVDLIGNGIKRGLRYADKKEIPFTVIIGGDEIKKGIFILKNMSSGIQTEIKRTDLGEKENLPQLQ